MHTNFSLALCFVILAIRKNREGTARPALAIYCNYAPAQDVININNYLYSNHSLRVILGENEFCPP